MKKERFSGIDIIKIIAIIFVPFVHFYMNFDFDKINMLHIGNILQIMVRWLTFSCIGLFIMSSGYLLCEKKPSKKYYKKILYFLLLYLIALTMTYTFVNHFNTGFLKNIILLSMKFEGYFWYVSFYICLYALIPYLNIVIEKLNKKQYLIFLTILIILTSLAITVNSIPRFNYHKTIFLPGSFMVLWPGVYYYIGAYFKKFQPNIRKRNYILFFSLALLFISVLDFIFSKNGPANFIGGGYGNLITVIVTTCVFGLLYKIKFKNKIVTAITKYCASLTFETYLSLSISDILTQKIIHNFLNIGFVEYKYILIAAPINFLLAFIIGIIIHYIAKFLLFLWSKLPIKISIDLKEKYNLEK